MKSFLWDKHFETGLTNVDEQHRQLVEMTNQLCECVAHNTIVFSEINALYVKLTEYAQYHFADEESLMNSVNIDQRHKARHFGEHRTFLQNVTGMYNDIAPDSFKGVEKLLAFLIYWLAYHILGLDQNMSRQIRSIRNGVSPEEAYNTRKREDDHTTEPLLAALNGLFTEVSEANKELRILNRSLEKQVAERTRKLTEANRYLEEIALSDALTGLFNRRYAMQSFDVLWTESFKNDTPLACMMIDADCFKAVNDTYGHDAGDEVLRQLATTLKDSLRNDDIVCRLGGDEFLAICPNTNYIGVLHVAELIRKTVSELRVSIGNGHWQGSVSLGVAIKNPEMKGFDDLIKLADRGVYAAKNNGKNCVCMK